MQRKPAQWRAADRLGVWTEGRCIEPDREIEKQDFLAWVTINYQILPRVKAGRRSRKPKSPLGLRSTPLLWSACVTLNQSFALAGGPCSIGRRGEIVKLKPDLLVGYITARRPAFESGRIFSGGVAITMVGREESADVIMGEWSGRAMTGFQALGVSSSRQRVASSRAQRRTASMSFPIKNLPVVQHWDCHSCGDCCRRLEGVITEEEKVRIEALDLANDPEVAPKPWFAPLAGRGTKKWTLKHRPDGGCVFLTAGNHCRLQERFGAEVKPFVCRLFPFMLIPAGNHWRVGMRFSCPSAAANAGRPVVNAEKDLVRLSHLLEKHEGRSADSAPAPLLQAGQQLPWADVGRVVQVLVEIVQDRSDRLERRMRKCLAVARVCRGAKLDGLKGKGLSEFLQVLRAAVDTDVAREAADVPPPDRMLGKLLFRVLLPIFARRERDVHREQRRPARAQPGARRVAVRAWPWPRASYQRIPAGNQF